MQNNNSSLTQKVEHVIAEKVRPALRAHGGDIVLVEIKDRNVKVRFTGACSSCPSMQSTMEDIVVATLRNELGNEIDKIVHWTTVDDELIRFAQNFFKNKQKQ